MGTAGLSEPHALGKEAIFPEHLVPHHTLAGDTRSWPLALSCAARARGSDLESISSCRMTVDRGGSPPPPSPPHPCQAQGHLQDDSAD